MPHKPDVTALTTPTRLPCRGCQPNCSSYKVCDGKPWRLDAQPKPARH